MELSEAAVKRLIFFAYERDRFVLNDDIDIGLLAALECYFEARKIESSFVVVDGEVIKPDAYETFEDFKAAHNGREVALYSVKKNE